MKSLQHDHISYLLRSTALIRCIVEITSSSNTRGTRRHGRNRAFGSSSLSQVVLRLCLRRQEPAAKSTSKTKVAAGVKEKEQEELVASSMESIVILGTLRMTIEILQKEQALNPDPSAISAEIGEALLSNSSKQRFVTFVQDECKSSDNKSNDDDLDILEMVLMKFTRARRRPSWRESQLGRRLML